MQRTGKKFFIYPDASRNQIYVGGQAEYKAYQQLHPEEQQSAQGAEGCCCQESAYRGNQTAAMRRQPLRHACRTPSWAQLLIPVGKVATRSTAASTVVDPQSGLH